MAENMKRVARLLLNKMGFDVVRLRSQNDVLASHLANVFKSLQIDCVLDVGANTGQYGRFLRKLGFTGYIVSFEPVRAVFGTLERTSSGDGKWLAYNLALGDQSGFREINVYDSTVFSSFLDINEYSKSLWTSIDAARHEQVTVARLDEVLNDIETATGAKSFFLKMDTQGFDDKVFAGSAGVIGKIAALQSELSLLSTYDEMPHAYDVLNQFHRQGFLVSGMYPVNRDTSLAVIEYDCVLVRR